MTDIPILCANSVVRDLLAGRAITASGRKDIPADTPGLGVRSSRPVRGSMRARSWRDPLQRKNKLTRVIELDNVREWILLIFQRLLGGRYAPNSFSRTRACSSPANSTIRYWNICPSYLS